MGWRLLDFTNACLIGLYLLVVGTIGVDVAEADVYKWKDANGTLHFGDVPPHQTPAEKVEIETDDKSVFQPSGDYLERQQKLLNVFEEERAIRREKQAKVTEAKAKIATACDRARQYEKRYAQANILYKEKPDGSREFISDQERKNAEAALQAFLQKNCRKH